MIDPRFGEQLELFPETKPEPKEEKPVSALSKQEEEIIHELRGVVEKIQHDAIILDGEDLEEEKFEMLHYLREDLGVPEYLVKEWVMPLYNVPQADSEYLLEHLLESFNPPLFKKYVAEKEAFFNQLLKGDSSC